MRKKWLVVCGVVVAAGLAVTTFLVRAEGERAKVDEGVRTANSRLTHVTVYQNSALVTREVDVPEGPGTMELVVSPLPPTTDANSLYSEGSDGLHILTTRFRSRAIQEDVREEVRKLEAKLKEKMEAGQKLASDLKTADQNLKMLDKLEGFTGASTQHMTEKGTLNGETIITLTKYVMDTRGEKMKEKVTLEQQQTANQEQMQFIQRQLNELSGGSGKTERDAVIVVEKKNANAGKVRLNYLVHSGGWRPTYKFRAGTKEKDAVQVEYLAAVTQQSGEDWGGVQLTLSTAQPMLNAAPPELKMLEVALTPRGASGEGKGGQGGFGPGMPNDPGARGRNFQEAANLRQQGQADYNQKKEMSGNEQINRAAAIEQTDDILWVTRDEVLARQRRKAQSMAREGQSVTYHLANRLTVPSRGDEQVIEVAKLSIEPEYYYKAVPVLTPHVYRLANLTNKSESVLLPGEATMYIGTDFVGRMDLPLVAVGELMTVGFGVDPQLQVTRQMMDKAKTMQGGNQVLKYDYRILVSSYKSEPVSLQLWDRLPHAESETVNVSLVKAEPEVCSDPLYLREQRPNNLLRWDLKVEPGVNGEKARTVKYEFKMELDKQMLFSNFTTK